MKRVAAVILENKKGERLKFFSTKQIPKVKFANILKKIVMDYINSKN